MQETLGGKIMNKKLEENTNNIIPRTGEAIDFLKRWYGDKDFPLVSIVPDGKITAKTFNSQQSSDAYKWIEARQGKENLYFHVNIVSEKTKNKKAKDADITEVLCVHVDIDHDNALEIIKAYEVKPTVVIWSGNGIHAYLRYTTILTNMVGAASRNYAMAKKLSGDKCHDVSRILRLPGTINIPNKKKREKGRVPTLSYIITELTDWNRLYEHDDFEELEPEKSKSNGDITVKICTIDDLPAAVSDYCKQVIIHGDDPENPRGSKNAKYPSRSEALFRVCCELIRVGCSDEQVCGIITNPAYKISESVLEKHNPYEYALRQIRRVKETLSKEWPNIDKAGNPKQSYENVRVALRRLNISLSYDTFRNRMAIYGIQIQEFQGEITDNVVAVLRDTILDTFDFDSGNKHVEDAIKGIALENVFHPIKGYLENIKWDGISRIEMMLIDYFGAKDTPLNRAISKLMMVAVVRRVMQPGVKFDTIIVLEGVQGTGKSTALSILAGEENFSDQDILSLDAKGQMEAMEGVWIFEICELSGLSKSETSKVKAFASRTHDKARMAYAHYSEKRPRQNILVGTTNENTYLKDETGNRRFLPVRTGIINLESLKNDRDQLWAEAAILESEGKSITLPESLWQAAAEAQEERMELDPWLDILKKDVKGYLAHGVYRITSTEILSKVLDIPEHQQYRSHWSRLATLMKKLGWDGPKTITFSNGFKGKGYERPAGEDPVEQEEDNDSNPSNGNNLPF